MWATFNIYSGFIALIIFDLLYSENLDKLYFFMLVLIETLLAGIGQPLRKPDMVYSRAQHCGSFCFRFLALIASEL